jgi:hypothetical protein
MLNTAFDRYRERLFTQDRQVSYFKAIAQDRLKDAAEAYLQSAGPDDKGNFVFDIRASIVPLLAEHLASAFKKQGGRNYIQIEVTHDELGPLQLTLQRRWGEMPSSRAARFENALRSIANINNGPDLPSGEWRCQEAARIAESALNHN